MMENPYIHPSSYVDNNVTIGKGTKIWHFCHLMENSYVGEDCVLGQNVFLGKGVKIGSESRIQNNVSVFEGVTLEENVFCGPSVVFTNDLNPRAGINRPPLKTIVRMGATIGANATIVCGNIIGTFSMIGAGTVVTRDVPDHSLVIGNPARIAGWMCHCGLKLRKVSHTDRNDKYENTLACGDCHNQYKLVDKRLSKIQ